MPDDDQYQWRETYFIWFEAQRRPLLEKVEEAVRHLRGHFELESGEADADGLISTLTVRSREDHAALEIECAAGGEVRAEGAAIAADISPADVDPDKLAQLKRCDARFEVMHFEEVVEQLSEEEMDDMFDPSALLVVLEALVQLTDGICVDPQAGSIM
ncbi:MAG TPA: hypothetical protein VIK18_15390 [Pirellulales bacterium]